MYDVLTYTRNKIKLKFIMKNTTKKKNDDNNNRKNVHKIKGKR